VKNNYRYGLFGSMLPASTQPLANLFAFLGAFSVPSVGPYSLMAHRLYDARQGRFTASDPVRFDMGTGTSSYVYAAQSPLGLIDPSGLFQFGDLFNINSSVYSFADNPSLLQGANLDVCNFSFTLITSTCKKAGLTDNDIAIVKGVQTVSLQAFTLGGSTALTGTVETAQTLLSGAGYVSDELTYGPQVVQLLQGKLSPQDQSTLLRNLSLEMLSVGTDQFISDYSKQVGLSAAQQLAAVVAQQVGLTAIGAGVNALPSPASTPPAGGQSTGTHK